MEILPVINKIDLPSARPDEIKEEIEDVIGIDCQDAPLISAKEGLNIEDVLEAIVKKVPPPGGDPDAPLKALIFDSYYDTYKGVCKGFEGTIKPGKKIKMMATDKFEVVEVGVSIQNILVDKLRLGM